MTARLALGEGVGFLARLADELLFVERRDDTSMRLTEAFLGAADGARIDAVTDLLDDGDAGGGHDGEDDGGGETVPPLIMVGWRDRIRVVVGGSARLETSPAKLSSLAEPGPHRWVERTLAADAGLELAAGDDRVLPISDLEEGAVPAGAMLLRLNQPVRESPAPADRTGAAGEPEVFEAAESAPMAPDRPAQLAQPSEPPRADRPDPAIAAPRLPTPPPPPTTGLGTLDWNDDSNGTNDGSPDGGPGWSDDPLGSSPSAAVGRIRFEDGRIERLDQAIVVGRGPAEASIPVGARAVVWDVPPVSKTHVLISPASAADAAAEIIDLGSRNGTYLLELAATELIALEPQVPRLIEPGVQVVIGEYGFVYEVVMT